MIFKNVLVVYTIPTTKEQKSTLEVVENTLKRVNVDYKIADRDKLSKALFQNKYLIIAVGGDGTFLRTAHFIDKQILFGVNSDIENKEGFFMKSDKGDFGIKLKRILEGKARIRKLPRLEAYINNKKFEIFALNEFFIGAAKSYHSAKYIISVDGKRERQKSSGILITTPAGSYSWAKSCCKKTLPFDSDDFQFIVREPYEWQIFKNYKLKYGTLNKNQKIIIISEMLDGILVADSVSKEHSFKNGSKAVIKLSNNHLNAVWM